MTHILIQNARIVDGTQDRAKDAVDIVLADGHVQEVGTSLMISGDMTVIDAKDSFVMPGLIDAHVHVIAQDANLKQNAALPDAIVTVGAMNLMRAMLARGFTTVRDLGGATGPLRVAMEQAPVPLPRLNISGKALEETFFVKDTSCQKHLLMWRFECRYKIEDANGNATATFCFEFGGFGKTNNPLAPFQISCTKITGRTYGGSFKQLEKRVVAALNSYQQDFSGKFHAKEVAH